MLFRAVEASLFRKS
uniref:Uncharacterized protein n=1 Tax=Rhizophora mucronata TaxID=61149 RepID=A0A2P2IM27_RHIMU